MVQNLWFDLRLFCLITLHKRQESFMTPPHLRIYSITSLWASPRLCTDETYFVVRLLKVLITFPLYFLSYKHKRELFIYLPVILTRQPYPNTPHIRTVFSVRLVFVPFTWSSTLDSLARTPVVFCTLHFPLEHGSRVRWNTP